MSKIEKLSLESFRGSSTPFSIAFDPKKDMVLIFGENGSGKTTIVDALDAVANLSKGSLEDRSSTKARSHIPTLGKKPEDVRIDLKTASKSWITTLKGSKISSTPEPLPRIRILRRSRLLKLIEAQPADRYKALKQFIEVEFIENCENELNTALKGLRKEIDQLVAIREESESGLREIWETQGAPEGDLWVWARGIVTHDTSEQASAISVLKQAQHSMSVAVTARESLKKAETEVVEKNSVFQDVLEEVQSLQGIGSEETMRLVELLKKVEIYLDTAGVNQACPICERPISLDVLQDDLRRRRSALEHFEVLAKKRNVAEKKLRQAKNLRQNKEREVYEAVLILKNQNPFADVMDAYSLPPLGASEKIPIAAAIECLDRVYSKKEEIAAEESLLAEQAGLVKSIRVLYQKISESDERTKNLIRLTQALEKGLNIMVESRIEFTQDILDEIADECNRLYMIIHPGEGIGLSKIELDRAKRASLTQKASFAGHDDVPPQAYFSESHLDTLGFCLWLALSKRECPDGGAILVLDDIFTSVDSQHINRIAQLISDESQYFAHIIVTTHQRLWRDFYKYQQGPGNKTDMIELQGWTIGKGISSYQTSMAVHELAESLTESPFDRQITALRAGILLEAVLDSLALKYGCRVPRKHDNSYTLGELMSGTKKLFGKIEVHRPEFIVEGEGEPQYVRHLTSKVSDQMAKIASLVFIRNQVGAHFNVHGTGISDKDVQLFAELTVGLVNALSCEMCGQVPSRNTGSNFKCSCNMPLDLRMTPLQL